MSARTNTTATSNRNRLSLGRKAGLFLVGTAGALTLTGGLAGSASALTPAPKPTLPIAQAPQKPEPPVGPMVIGLPEDPGPVVDGPDQIAQPLPTPDPHPAPHPQGPGDLTIGEPDGPGFEGPDDFTNGEPDGPGHGGPDDFTNGEPDGPGFEGPDDFTNGEDPVDPGPEVTVPETTVPDTTPDTDEPAAEVLDEVDEADTTVDSVEVAAPEELAFTGGNMGVLAAALALLGAGGLAAGGAVIARRRNHAEV